MAGIAVGSAPPVLDEGERLARPELEALQLERLQWTVRHAYDNVPLCTRKLDGAGVHPDDIRRIAFTTKEDLRQSYPFGMFAVLVWAPNSSPASPQPCSSA